VNVILQRVESDVVCGRNSKKRYLHDDNLPAAQQVSDFKIPDTSLL
jgi:hypothetical protein